MADRDWLSATLRELRNKAGLSGVEAARLAGKSQRWISDIERGKLVPRETDLLALAGAYHAKAAVRRQLVAAARDLGPETRRARVILSRGGWQMQARIAGAERQSARIRAFQPAMVIGLAQTVTYMRSVFGSSGEITGASLDRTIAERITRQAILGTGRDITLIMTEGALRWQAVSPAVMVEQLDHLAEVSSRPGVQVGVIPWTAAAGVYPRGGFHLYDSRAVSVGTDAATALITDPPDVALYEKLFTELEALAVFDDQAREQLARIAEDFRALGAGN